MHKGTVVAMYSHEKRATARADTIAAFSRVGCPVAHVSIDEGRPRPRANRRNAWGALRHAARYVAPAVEAKGVLLIEDDVTPADTLADWLGYLERHEDRVVALYAPAAYLYPKRLARVARGERPAGKSEVATADLRAWWGAQALWFPTALADDLVRDTRLEAWEHGLGAWDTALRVLLGERSATLGVAVPNVVQHAGLPNLVNPERTPHTSAAFVQDAPAPAEREAVDAPRS